MGDHNQPFLPVSGNPESPPILDDTLHRPQGSTKSKLLLSVFAGIFVVCLIFAGGYDQSGVVKTPQLKGGDELDVGPIVMPAGSSIINPGAVSRGKSAGVSEKANLSPQKLLRSGEGSDDGLTDDFPWNNSMLSWQRTAFHFQPEKNWMNDPNGPLFYKGWYHFFYQYNPNAPVWGDIVWGHAVSRDMIHWLHLPLAMVADQWYDVNGVWTGSATILPDGKVMMLYTGSTNESVQVQNLAYPADHNDPLLLDWVKHPGNPVLVPPPGIHHKDFRDPTTAWRTSEGKWRITIGSKVNKTGIALVYDTEDFINYELKDGFLHGVPGTGMWECVDFYPVAVAGGNGLDTSMNGAGVRHVVKASLDDDRHDYYAIGTYEEATGKWYPDNPAIDVGIGIRYDYGIFYASKTFFDQSKQRRVLWGWIGEWDSEAADVRKGWASLQSMPRTVVLDTKTGSNLLQWPVEESESLRLRSKEFKNVVAKPGAVVPIQLEAATQLDIVVEFELDKEAVERVVESDEEFKCSSSRGASQRGALGPFGLLVLSEETLSEQTPVYFYVVKGKNATFRTYFCADQSRSSLANDVNKKIYGSYVPVLEGEKFGVRMLVDHSIIESFAQGGRSVITSRVYPTKAIYGAARLFLFNNATEAGVTGSLKVWQMNSAFIHPFPNL